MNRPIPPKRALDPPWCAAPDPQESLREQERLTDHHRGERSLLEARQTRELAKLITRQENERKALERRHTSEVRLWLHLGRARGRWLSLAEGHT